ncbi:MAG: NAD(+)/NADH kinase [Bacillota bacterium]|nr:NAD(+)/NADH kinase [Bacillota bacterium]
MQRIGILSNHKREDSRTEGKRVAAWLKREGAEVFQPGEPYDVTDQNFLQDYLSEISGKCDMLLVLGGDGTLLSVARQAAYHELPILGINMGRVGFLAELEPGASLYTYLTRLLKGDYYLEERMMLQVDLVRDGKIVKTGHCLNDGVVLRQNFSGLVKTMVFIDNKLSASYHSDGIVVATPTGASAYSLSANGPLVSPEMQAIVITPICAQSLYSRPIVVGAERKISIQVADIDGGCYLSIDGKTDTVPLCPGDTVNYRCSSMHTLFIRLNGKTFFDVLNEKLRDRR